MHKILCFFILFLMALTAAAQRGFSFKEKPELKQVDVLYNNKLLTSYAYFDSSHKPVLFPVNTVDGITVTRSYPFRNVAGERTDHPHHTGIWLNYESVNGLDFWNHSTAIDPSRRHLYGSIRHQEITGLKTSANGGTLQASAVWVRHDHKVLLNEASTYEFTVQGKDFIIDRTTTLTAADTVVVFKDVKDGLVAIRVARELELPSKEASKYVDEQGNVTNVPPSGTTDVTGMYHGSNGLKGDSVWSSKGPWVMMTGKKEGKEITIAIIDHPSNPGYPTYWHARGYGLFAANPLGRKIFSKGAEELNLTLPPGLSATFKYRFIIRSGKIPSRNDMDQLAVTFAKKK